MSQRQHKTNAAFINHQDEPILRLEDSQNSKQDIIIISNQCQSDNNSNIESGNFTDQPNESFTLIQYLDSTAYSVMSDKRNELQDPKFPTKEEYQILHKRLNQQDMTISKQGYWIEMQEKALDRQEKVLAIQAELIKRLDEDLNRQRKQRKKLEEELKRKYQERQIEERARQRKESERLMEQPKRKQRERHLEERKAIQQKQIEEARPSRASYQNFLTRQPEMSMLRQSYSPSNSNLQYGNRLKKKQNLSPRNRESSPVDLDRAETKIQKQAQKCQQVVKEWYRLQRE